MRRQTKKINKKISKIVKKYGPKKAIQLFGELQKFGGNNFRRTMTRIHRLAKKSRRLR